MFYILVFTCKLLFLLIQLNSVHGQFFETAENMTVQFKDRVTGEVQDSLTLEEFRDALKRVETLPKHKKHIKDLLHTFQPSIKSEQGVEGILYMPEIGESLKVKSEPFPKGTVVVTCSILRPHDEGFTRIEKDPLSSDSYTFIGDLDNSCSFVIKKIKNVDDFGRWIVRSLYLNSKTNKLIPSDEPFFVNGVHKSLQVSVGQPLRVHVRGPLEGNIFSCVIRTNFAIRSDAHRMMSNYDHFGRINNTCSFTIKRTNEEFIGTIIVITTSTTNYTRADLINLII